MKRAQADDRRRAKTTLPSIELSEAPSPAAAAPTDDAVSPPSLVGDLRLSRDALIAAIDLVRAEDPARLGPLVRELRETWKALDAIDRPATAEDEFAAARRRRAAARPD